MNPIKLQQAVSISLANQVQEIAQAQASMLLEGLAETQQNIQLAQAIHPTLGKVLDIKA